MEPQLSKSPTVGRNTNCRVGKKPTVGLVKTPSPPVAKLASPKERLKKILNKDNILPEWIKKELKELWDAFLEMREKKGAVPTERAKVLLIKKLEELRDAGDDPNEILKRSIINNWSGIFPLQRGQSGAYQGYIGKGNKRTTDEQRRASLISRSPRPVRLPHEFITPEEYAERQGPDKYIKGKYGHMVNR